MGSPFKNGIFRVLKFFGVKVTSQSVENGVRTIKTPTVGNHEIRCQGGVITIDGQPIPQGALKGQDTDINIVSSTIYIGRNIIRFKKNGYTINGVLYPYTTLKKTDCAVSMSRQHHHGKGRGSVVISSSSGRRKIVVGSGVTISNSFNGVGKDYSIRIKGNSVIENVFGSDEIDDADDIEDDDN